MSEGAGDAQNGTGGENNRSDSPPTDRSSSSRQQDVKIQLIQHFKANKVNATLWVTRLLSIFFTISYVFPLFTNAKTAFNKVLIANAVTSGLRLHQRLPTFRFSREYLSNFLMEDSWHYLAYSLIFYDIHPTLIIICPIALFAILHASSYSLQLLDLAGQNTWWGARFLISLVEFQAVNILKAVAFLEIFIMPLAVVMAFMGRVGILTPIVYYNFLLLRYQSRRNPYNRNAFSELRMATEKLANSSPPFVGKILRSAIHFVSRFAPVSQTAPQAGAQSAPRAQ